jgi:type IV pilus assembly protein PilC
LPHIAALFRELGAPLPLPTKVLLATSVFVQTNPFIVIGVVVSIIILIILALRTKKGRYFFHYVALKIPIFGKLTREKNLALFFRTLEALFASGISLMRSVEVAKKTIKNTVYQKVLDGICPVLLHGTNLSEAFKPFPFLFPLQLQRIIEVGEESGKLEESFRNLNEYYDRTVRHKTQMITATLEPIVLIIAGLAVGGLALSIFMPLYESIQIL